MPMGAVTGVDSRLGPAGSAAGGADRDHPGASIPSATIEMALSPLRSSFAREAGDVRSDLP